MKSKIKIVVISDTHKNISNAIDAIEREKPRYILHLGDHSEDGAELAGIYPEREVIAVSGNCDWRSFSAPSERMLDIDGVKILMCHGHMYSVKSGVWEYITAAREKGAHVALFGHTHKPMLDNLGDIIVMNPGSVSTYGVIEIEKGKASARMCDFED